MTSFLDPNVFTFDVCLHQREADMNPVIKVSYLIMAMKVTVSPLVFPDVTFLDLLDPTEYRVQYFSVKSWCAAQHNGMFCSLV